MRYYLAFAALSLVLAGAAVAATTRSHGPLQLGSTMEGGGSSSTGRYEPDAHFELGVLIRNASSSRLVLTGARVVEPARTLMHQIGSRFHPWNPPSCPPNVGMCPLYAFRMTARANHPQPFALAPGKQAGVELDFQFGSCAEIPSANLAPVTRLAVTFREPDGTLRRQVLSLGRASLFLRRPKLVDCRDPHSSLTVAGPSRYVSSDRQAIVGSTGDVCTTRNGRLDFVSRKYRTRSSYERVTLQMHFHGAGTYSSRVTLKLVADRKVVFLTHPVVDVTKATSREVIGLLDAARSPFHISGTMRCRVRG